MSDNKRVAKNTIVLYFRMFLTLIVGLYTSRVILNSLGFSDYGIYNVVGGVVTMMAFLNVGMAGASQRFISYELGKENESALKKVFSTSIITHITIAAIVAIIMESIGIWFLNYKLNIPSDRLFAANVVFQCSIITFIISVISVPYNSLIIAYEKMNAYAYISIFEVFAKLTIAYSLSISNYDKLIMYAALILSLQITVRLLYSYYCKKHFRCSSFNYYEVDKGIFKKMFSFAGWGCIGNMGFTLKDQGSNIILNIFFGTTINAARGIATQVNGIINGFASNFTMALNPQITKLYAAGDIEGSKRLAFAGSKYALYLLSIISIPFIINKQYVLTLWLGSVPEYTDVFVTIILVASIIYSMSHSISTAILATGHVKQFQTLLALLLLSELPIAYLILYFGGKPYHALLPALVTNLCSLFLRIWLLHKLIPSYEISCYAKNVFICLGIFGGCLCLSLYIKSFFDDSLMNLVITSSISVLITVVVISVIGLEQSEKASVVKILKNKFLSRFTNKK